MSASEISAPGEAGNTTHNRRYFTSGQARDAERDVLRMFRLLRKVKINKLTFYFQWDIKPSLQGDKV